MQCSCNPLGLLCWCTYTQQCARVSNCCWRLHWDRFAATPLTSTARVVVGLRIRLYCALVAKYTAAACAVPFLVLVIWITLSVYIDSDI